MFLTAVPGYVLDRQHLFAAPLAAFGMALLMGVIGLRDVAPDHGTHQFLARHLGCRGGHDELAVAQHSDAI
jgi:hypothetical protein